jgi:hypothetical protein
MYILKLNFTHVHLTLRYCTDSSDMFTNFHIFRRNLILAKVFNFVVGTEW